MVDHRPSSPTVNDATNRMQEVTIGPPTGAPQSTSALKRRNKKKKKTLDSDTGSSASSNNFSYATSFSKKGIKIFRNPKRIRVGSLSTATARRTAGPSDVDALGLPLGMSIAAFVAQVLERKNAVGENMSADYLSRICGLAVRESLGNVFGDKFENFAANFEKSFQSTLMTLRLLSGSSQNVEEQVQRHGCRRCDKISSSGDELISPICHSESTNDLAGPRLYHDEIKGPTPTCSYSQRQTRSHTDENMKTDISTGSELVVHNKKDQHQLICSNSNFNQISIIEKSVMEQTRSNNLKTFEIELRTRKLQLMEKQLELSSTSNLLERWKLSMGISKAAFRTEKFKTQLQDSRQAELLKKLMDFLVAGLFIMLFFLGYGTYVHSHRKIIEITEACSPYTESKSSSWWWIPKPVENFKSGFQLFLCQFQVGFRILFGVLMIGAIAFMLIQRSSSSHQAMPVSIIVLLLGVTCGSAGKFCVDTLGGSGNEWLIYWEALCALHLFANVFHSSLYLILNGPVTVAERVNRVFFAYWVRRVIFFAVLLVVPVLCGLMPYAGMWEWCEHFRLLASELLGFDDD